MEANAVEKQKVQLGSASIKAEYIAVDHVRQLNLEFITKEDKNKVTKCNEVGDGSINEPPKKKLKGQNKKRPQDVKIPKSQKLCFKISTDGSCPYGDSCCYSHDIDSYVANKPADLGQDCYLFNTFGRCPYGFACRFGAKHIVNGQNVCNEDLWNEMKDKQTTLNVLSHDMKVALWKKNYNFKKSGEILRIIQNEKWKENLKVTEITEEVCDSDAKCDLSEVSHSDVEVPVPELISDQTSASLLEVNSEQIQIKKEPHDSIRNKLVPLLDEDTIQIKKEPHNSIQNKLGPSLDEDTIHLKPHEVKKVDFSNKLYLAPLTTVGNLPFRRICKEFGADITCGEMAIATNLLQAQLSEWALVKRHHTEDIFGVQICGSHPEIMTRCTQLLNEKASVDFIDVNMGCPIDFIYQKGSGCGLMTRMKRLEDIIYGMSSVSDVPITLKMRTGVLESTKLAHTLIKKIHYLQDFISLVTIHGRSREQRYTKSADWDYIKLCSEAAHPIPLFGSGDVLSYEDYNLHKKEANVQGIMIARGALIKPWIFTEIKEQRHWDISSTERFDIIKSFVNYGLEHWGSDSEGVKKTRKFLLEWLSFQYRYIPVGLLERIPQHINERPPAYFGRNELETLMASPSCADWIKISEMFLGPVPENFTFLPKHKANAYS